ncbi:MAG: cytosine permease [Prolixibacteraceae bacterium]
MNQTTNSKATMIERLDALYEFDREPVSSKKLHGWKTFIAMFAGEHVAGTEFVLGPLMVMHGVSAKDFLLGLLVGNILAVLSWALLTAPVAVKVRLTIYWQLKKIIGPYLTIAYSIFYAIVLCLLAGAMVNVAVTAISIPFGIPNPDFVAGDVIPSFSWMMIALIVGVVISALAVLGFEKIAHFSKICAPWMILVFFAAAVAIMAKMFAVTEGGLWEVLSTKIFTGVPIGDNSKYTFWHVAGFAWLCNGVQHLGMSDVTIFRYAKKWTQGFASAFGMFIGHFGAWVASGILCAAYLSEGFVNPQPGTIALYGAGIAGAVSVVIAGWTTANPTLYRAGLAIQVATPNWKRWKVTFAAGLFMIITACIPAVNANLDRIVSYNGLFFIPLGAFVIMDFWIFPKIGLISNFTEKAGKTFSWPSAIAWFGPFLLSVVIYGKDHIPLIQGLFENQPDWMASIKMDLTFLVGPEWLLAALLYLIFSYMQQKKKQNLATIKEGGWS